MDCKQCGEAGVANEYTCPTCQRKGCEKCMPDGESKQCASCDFHKEDLPQEERLDRLDLSW